MKRKRHTTEQIISILRQADTGKTVQEICRSNNVSEQTFYRWRKKYGNLELADAKRFKELEKENTEQKKLLADQMLKNQVMEETLSKKVVSPKQKKRVVKDAAERGLCSLRRACAYLSLSWSTYSYRPKQAGRKAQRLAERIVTLSWEHPRYGYRGIRALLVKEGWTTSRKFVQSVRRSEGLQVKPPKKRRHRQGVSTGSPTKANGRNHVWSWDFVHDRTDNGGPLKIMTLIDEYTRKCLHIRVARQLTSTDVLSVLREAIEEEGVPSYIRSDNGSEFIAHQVQQWLSNKNIKALYIDPGSPWQNGFIESFHNRLRDECLNREVLLSVAEAQVVIEQWRQTYNNEHPHSRLGFKSPQEFVRFLSDLGRARATPSLRQDLSYTSILKPLTPGNSLT